MASWSPSSSAWCWCRARTRPSRPRASVDPADLRDGLAEIAPVGGEAVGEDGAEPAQAGEVVLQLPAPVQGERRPEGGSLVAEAFDLGECLRRLLIERCVGGEGEGVAPERRRRLEAEQADRLGTRADDLEALGEERVLLRAEAV